MSASRRYRLAPLADRDLEDIWSYSHKNWSEQQADQYIIELMKAFADLAASRRQGTPLAAHRGYLRLVVGSHAIFYRASSDAINIIRILHQSMDTRRHL